MVTRMRRTTIRAVTVATAVVVGVQVGMVQTVVETPSAAAATVVKAPAKVVRTPAPAVTAWTPVPTAPAPAIRCGVPPAAQAAVDVATAADETSAVAVLDTTTGTLTSAGEATTQFNTASVVKVLLATELLVTGQMTGDTADTALQMITRSDDDAADALYELAGSDDVVNLVAQRYGIADLGSPPEEPGQWGESQVTAKGLAELYAALQHDPVVWPWLSAAMAATTTTAEDGSDQTFGIPSAAASWAVKQGWMVGLGPGATYSSTGYVDDGRWVVVLLSSGTAAQYGEPMTTTMTSMAKALMPDGVAPGVAC